MTEITRKRKNS